MLIADEACFSLIVPTYEGTPFLRRQLDYLKAQEYPGHVLLSDNSSGAHRDFVAACPAEYPSLWLDVDAYDPGIGFLDKLVRTMQKLPARNVMLCAQDDFIVPDALERLLTLLEADAALSCVRGHVARFRITPGSESGAARSSRVDLNKHPMLPYVESDTASRVLSHMRAYTSTLYSVHRRALLMESCALTDASTKSAVFFQYLQSCLTVAQGRVGFIEGLYLARQIHGESWSARMIEGDYEHWPLLLASPDYSRYYAEFRDALAKFLAAKGCGMQDELGKRIDAEYVSLIRRSFCSTSHSDASNDAFFSHLNTEGMAEQRAIDEITRFALPYTDTY
jgi:glycosyltransferase domain-containing protein